MALIEKLREEIRAEWLKRDQQECAREECQHLRVSHCSVCPEEHCTLSGCECEGFLEDQDQKEPSVDETK